ncbi:MAG: dihydroorotate dehydrogenase, partial [Syntrophobacteraceae bacterium]|nr:dihydroorotate dehydrogenase [Syntrophobacteraceae bacterium]
QIGTANFVHPSVTLDVIDGIRRFLQVEQIASVEEFIGTLDTRCLFPFAEESCLTTGILD